VSLPLIQVLKTEAFNACIVGCLRTEVQGEPPP